MLEPIHRSTRSHNEADDVKPRSRVGIGVEADRLRSNQPLARRIRDGLSRVAKTAVALQSRYGSTQRARLSNCRAGGKVLEDAGSSELAVLLQRESIRREQLEGEVVELRLALEEVQKTLVGTQAEEKRARYLALHDRLTELPNRDFFFQWLTRALSTIRPPFQSVAVLYLDLDDFKAVNDRFGHDVGDELLKIVARRLAGAVRAEDMVSRLGGDEFGCVIAGQARHDQLVLIANTLFAAVSSPMKIHALDLAIQPSIGIASCPVGGSTADRLLKSADAAMYIAKRTRSRFAFDMGSKTLASVSA